MINLENELAQEYLAQSQEYLATVESDLLTIEKNGVEIDEETINRVFRAVHSVRGGAGFFDLVKIGRLAYRMEDVLTLIRNGQMLPASGGIRVLRRATDRLDALIRNASESNQADIDEVMADLAALHADRRSSGRGEAQPVTRHLQTLLVEDDFACRLVLQTFLSRYGECHIAVNGREAVDAFRSAWERDERYDLICMDIMMPEMDGREAVRQMRAFEAAHGVLSNSGAKIIMTTTIDEVKEVIRCFQELCDAYLMKPIDLGRLLDHMKSYQLVK